MTVALATMFCITGGQLMAMNGEKPADTPVNAPQDLVGKGNAEAKGKTNAAEAAVSWFSSATTKAKAALATAPEKAAQLKTWVQTNPVKFALGAFGALTLVAGARQTVATEPCFNGKPYFTGFSRLGELGSTLILGTVLNTGIWATSTLCNTAKTLAQAASWLVKPY